MLNTAFGDQIREQYEKLKELSEGFTAKINYSLGEVTKNYLEKINRIKEIRNFICVILWKISSLHEAIVILERTSDSFPKYVIIRSVIENVAILHFIANIEDDIFSKGFQEQFSIVMYGTRYAPFNPDDKELPQGMNLKDCSDYVNSDKKRKRMEDRIVKAKNILTFIEKLDKVEPCFLTTYHELSDFIHYIPYHLSDSVKSG